MAKQVPIRANVAAQTFDITLDNVSYTMVAKWNSRSEYWTLDISDVDGNIFITGLCLKLGASLLVPFNFDIGELIMIDDTSTGLEATLDNIGVTSRLIYFTQDELEAIAA